MEIDNLLKAGFAQDITTPLEAGTAAKLADTKNVTPAFDKYKNNTGEVSKTQEKDEKKPMLRLPSDVALQKAVEEANKKLQMSNRQLNISVHKKTKQIMVKIIDTASDEVIREIPAEKTLDFLASILEKTGVLVDTNS